MPERYTGAAVTGRGFDIRAAAPVDDAAVLELLAEAMGWEPDERYGAYFAWKHRQSPFGRSPAWVAVADGEVVGFRTFLRWEFTTPGGDVVHAVRAVDTATHPDFRGRGIFRALTMHALDRLTEQGVAFVFNTPNDRSRPGYLKMGWEQVGRVPLRARPTSARALLRMARARVPADRWPVACAVGVPAAAALEDTRAVAELVASQPRPHGMRTNRSVDYLRWRYGFEPLGYRALTGAGGPAEGVVLFRVRRRGAAIEVTVGDVLVPSGAPRRRRHLLDLVLRRTRADYAVGTAASARGARFLPVPGQGPILTWRAVTAGRMHARGAWDLSLGDVELL